MEYSWQGSDKRKLSLIQDLFKSESESTEEFFKLSTSAHLAFGHCNFFPNAKPKTKY